MFKSARGQRRLRGLGVAAAAVAVVLVAGYVAYTLGYVRPVYPSRAEFPVHGVDASHHQGRVDWEHVRAAGYEFAYLKATEGATFIDSTYARNRAQARRAGLVTGPYHFFTLCTDAAAQASHLLSVQPPDTARSLPPAVDLEFGGNCGQRPPADSVRAEIGRFLQLADRAYGKPAVLYVTPEFHDAYLRGGVAGHQLWVRSLFRRPRYGGEWAFWQYAARARVNGVSGPVDLDAFNGTRVEFEALVAPRR
ncbi:MAG TPA: GH25 family lysozyme [Longimicrobium sp.]|nr:GH25 family lysozyme [Longimicrobium sp.]